MKKPIPIPTSRRKAVQGAVLLAMTVLQDERVREQVRRAPVAAREWAERRRQADRVIDVGGPSGGSFERLDPTQRFGQRGVDRRLNALDRNVRVVFPDATDPGRVAIRSAVDELRRANEVTATMPLADRRRARRRITDEVGRLEHALVDAILPPESSPAP